jgi:hypothetical protein
MTVFNDSAMEPDESIVLTISAWGGSGPQYTVGTPNSATALILDNDTTVVTVEHNTDAKEGVTNGSFEFTRTGSTSQPLTVNYTVGGVAESGVDFAAPTGSVTFAMGSATAFVPITVIGSPYDDGIAEYDESVDLSLSSGSGYVVGTPGSATLFIRDNEQPVVMVEKIGDSLEGATSGEFAFSRRGDMSQALTVNFGVSGTATSGTDFTPLGTTVAFVANEGVASLDVEALADSDFDPNQTVTVTIQSGTGYTIDTVDDATITILEMPLTVSVAWVADGTEGAGNGTFRFYRNGDLSDPLTVTFAVGGSATSGNDFAALSDSVTFLADEVTVDLTVTVTNDASIEPTETVTVTLDESENYLLGNESDSLFIHDNDGSGTIWVSTGSTDWTVASNWSGNAVPTAGDQVYFIGSYSNVNCTNVGTGLSTLAGLHFQGAYSGVATLANALSVSTFEMLTGTLNQPTSDRDLTVTGAMIWNGGTLNSIDSGAEVNVSGAVGRIDPPDIGSMAIASTLNVLSGAVVTLFGGTLRFTGGTGMYIAAEVRANRNVTVLTDANVAAETTIDTTGEFWVARKMLEDTGWYTWGMPILNKGWLSVNTAIHFIVKGHLGGGNGPSIKQESGTFSWQTGANIEAEFGMIVTGGTLKMVAVKDSTRSVLVGEFTLDGGTLQFVGHGRFTVQGDVTWASGTYSPYLDGTNGAKYSLWESVFTFKIGPYANITLAPVFAPGTQGAAGEGRSWIILAGEKGMTDLNGNRLPFPLAPLPVGQQGDYGVDQRKAGDREWWRIVKW